MLTGFVLISTGVQQTGLTVVIGTIACAAVGLPALRNECKRYAIAQVRAIVADPVRCELVREAFKCLEKFQQSQPLAA